MRNVDKNNLELAAIGLGETSEEFIETDNDLVAVAPIMPPPTKKPDIPNWEPGGSTGDGNINWWVDRGTKLHDTSNTNTGRDVVSRGEYKMGNGETHFENLMNHIPSGAGKGTFLYTRIEGNDGDNVIRGWNYDNRDNFKSGGRDYYSQQEHEKDDAKVDGNYDHRDNISGGDGNDTIFGYCGDDQLFGDGGNDVIYGGTGHDYIEGGTGNDVLFGEEGNDKILGGEGQNILIGGAGNDTLIAGDEGDKLYGGEGNDLLIGGDGDDVLFTGHINASSSDVLYGGKGADTFVIGGMPEQTTPVKENDPSNGLGESWLEDAANLALAKMVPGMKLMMMLGKSLVQGLTNMFRTDEEVVETYNPPELSLVKITDFNPLEDKITVPVNAHESATIDIQKSMVEGAAFDLIMIDPKTNAVTVIATFEWDVAANIIPGASYISDDMTDHFIQRLRDTAFISGPDGVQYGMGQKIDLGFSNEDVAGLGTAKFVSFGAFGGISMIGSSDKETQMGTNYGDVLQGYISNREDPGEGSPEIRNDDNDSLYGFGGDDILAGGGGFNKLFGGEGNDTAWYGDSLSGIYVDMTDKHSDADGEYYWAWHGNSANAFDLNAEIRNTEGYDNLWSVENIFGSDHNDVIIGDDEDNVFTSGLGDDVLTGNGGADTFILTGDENTITDFNANDGDRIEIDLDAYGMTGWFDLGHRIENGQIVLFNKLTDHVIVRYDDDGNGFDPSVIDLRSVKGNDNEGYHVVYEPAYGSNTLEWFEKYGNRIDVDTQDTLDAVDGTDSWDYMVGSEESGLVTMNGGGGDDYIVGGTHDQIAKMYGGDGDDIIMIRNGALIATADGGDGDDVIILNADQTSKSGIAELTGGAGSDTFVFTGPSYDGYTPRILDFEADDSIVFDLNGLGLSSLNGLDINYSNGNCTVSVRGEKVVTIQNVNNDYDIMQHISELTPQQSQDWGL